VEGEGEKRPGRRRGEKEGGTAAAFEAGGPAGKPPARRRGRSERGAREGGTVPPLVFPKKREAQMGRGGEGNGKVQDHFLFEKERSQKEKCPDLGF